jgi:hypothetical protein
MKKDTKNTYEIDIIDIDGDYEKTMIPALEYFREQLLRASKIPYSYFDNKNYRRRKKINKIISKWDWI